MLSKKTKYAIHALTYLAQKDASNPTLIVEIAKEANIPRKFLETILLDLKKSGMVGSRMGKGGGYFIRVNPSEMKLSLIIRLFNGPIAMLPCASLNYYEKCEECTDEVTCGLRHVMAEVRDETLKILENKSIQDILDNEGILNKFVP
ncbi:MAG: Rrf2 family transcriptional regulator [Flavobacteriia bacterium]|nr:Rrf2 family transcriptional regulator [Flavobacteriia bacterium]